MAERFADAVVEYMDSGRPTCALDLVENQTDIHQADVAEILGVSRQRVIQIEARIRRDLRKTPGLREVWQEAKESIGRRRGQTLVEGLDSPDYGDPASIRRGVVTHAKSKGLHRYRKTRKQKEAVWQGS